MKFPEDLKYTKEHEWVKMLDSHTALVGITDFAQKELGDIVFVEVETIGETLKKDAVFGTVEAVKTVSDLFLPISGQIVALNPDLADNPQFVNHDAYQKGWIIQMKVENTTEYDALMSASEYKAMLGRT
jgi:glycine cleavage system H protein